MDDIMDLLGPDLSQVPSSKGPWDDLPPMQEPVVTDTTNQADLWLPTNVAMIYREYDRSGPAVDSLMEKIKRDGILTPIQISTNGSVAVVHEGNHRLQVADRLGIGRIPCRITYDLPIISNGGMVAPLEPILENWVSMNKDRMRSFRGSRKEAFEWGKSPWAEKDYLNPSYAEYGPMTLYRGYSFEANAGVKDELLERIKSGESINAVFEDALTEMRYSVMQFGEAVGRYWTTDKDYALKLALVDSSSDDHVGLYIQAHWEGGDHDIDFGESDRTNYWGNESEVRLFSGTQLKGMEVGIYINGRWYVGKGSRDFVAEVRSVAGTEWQPGPVYRGLNTDMLTHEKTASPQTLYRGIPLSPDKATSDRIQRSFEAGDFYTVGEEILRIVDRDTGAGTSWTTRDGVAVRFALSNDSWIPYGSFAVVLEGHWAGGNIDHSRDRDDDDPDRYEEFEDEVRLFAGDKVTVTKISVRAGTRAQDAESYMESLKWTTWDVHRTLTALNEKSVEKRKTTSQRYAERLAKYRR